MLDARASRSSRVAQTLLELAPIKSVAAGLIAARWQRMTLEEMEKSLDGLMVQMKHIEDAQIVQGVLERRIEDQIDSLADRIDSLADRIDSLAAAAEATNSAVDKLLQVAAGHEERLAGVEDRLAASEERWARTEAAMHALFEQMDRFIRGLGADGHKGTPEQ
jgi:chromosome segregation ATPase